MKKISLSRISNFKPITRPLIGVFSPKNYFSGTILYSFQFMKVDYNFDEALSIRVFRKSLFVELDPVPKICDANRYGELTIFLFRVFDP